MANYFITSFAAAENRSYAARFHDDLAKEVRRRLGQDISAQICDHTLLAEARRSLVAETGVLVVLCSPDYYGDSGCGRDWALFQHRLDRVRAQWRPSATPMRVLVRWRPVTTSPPGLPRAPMMSDDVIAGYDEKGLYGVVRDQGPDSEAYRRILRALARSVCAGHTACLPPLPTDDRPEPVPAFPLAPARRTTVPLPRHSRMRSASEPEPEPDPRAWPRVFISYAQDEDDPGHSEQVADLVEALRRADVDVRWDRDAEDEPQNWKIWMRDELEEANFIIIVASKAYKRRAEQREPGNAHKGARWEGAYVMDEAYRNASNWHRRILRVVLPGHSEEELPYFPGSESVTFYEFDPAKGDGTLPKLVQYLKKHRRTEHGAC